jgi:hypothetical protein
LKRGHYEGQIQYNFDLKEFLNSEWTVGVDYRDATAETQNHVYGRNENDDDYIILGGYAQGKFKLVQNLIYFLQDVMMVTTLPMKKLFIRVPRLFLSQTKIIILG